MTDYQFDNQLVIDALDENAVIREGMVSLYAADDEEGIELIPIKGPSGVPLPNPLPSNALGIVRRFVTTDVPKVHWKSGQFSGFFFSHDGLLNEAVTAREAAQGAKLAAETAGLDAAAAAEEQMSVAVAAAQTSANVALEAQDAVTASAMAAQQAAEAAEGGGIAEDPADADAFLITTKADGTVVVDPDDADALIITV